MRSFLLKFFAFALLACLIAYYYLSSEYILRAFMRDIESEITNSTDMEHCLNIQVPFSGTLIFASPYSVFSDDKKLIFQLNKDTRDKLSDISGLSNLFYCFLVENNGHILHIKWSNPPFVFNDLLIIKCSKGDILQLNVQKTILRSMNIKAQRGQGDR